MSERGEAMASAMRVVLRDFQQPTPVDLQVWVDDDRDDEMVRVGGAGWWVQGESTGDELLVDAAWFLQDQVFSDGLAETWGEARPPCPGHQHPADTTYDAGEAWWCCPRTHGKIARIGQLPPP